MGVIEKALSKRVTMVAIAKFLVCDKVTAKLKDKTFKSLNLHFYLTSRIVTIGKLMKTVIKLKQFNCHMYIQIYPREVKHVLELQNWKQTALKHYYRLGICLCKLNALNNQ